MTNIAELALAQLTCTGVVGTARVCHFQGRVLLTDHLLRPADLPYGTALGTVLWATGFSLLVSVDNLA